MFRETGRMMINDRYVFSSTEMLRIEEPLRKFWDKQTYMKQSAKKKDLPVGLDPAFTFLS